MAEHGHGVGVHLILIADGSVLLGLRENTGFADGCWSVPGGRLEPGEPLTAGVVREAAEEVGIEIAEADLEFAHLCHHQDPDGRARLGVFFTATAWAGEPINREPEKCSKLAWHPLTMLPDNTVDYARTAIHYAIDATHFSQHGWPS
jgi:8-oxo-dGTP diphosphatase